MASSSTVSVLIIDTRPSLPGWLLLRARPVRLRRFRKRRHGFHRRMRLQLDLKPGLAEEGAVFIH